MLGTGRLIAFGLVLGVTTMLPGAICAQNKTVDEAFEKAEFVSGGELKALPPLKYRILRPEKVSEDAQYPLVLFLHGAGERGGDNQAQLKHAAGEFLARRSEY
ncbi:MAG: hypothetical protein AAF664_19415, partial [Planctomycetota bacterium]